MAVSAARHAVKDIRGSAASSYTITQNRSGMTVDDSRFKWKDVRDLPKPRDFKGVSKHYKAGRGSSVPLDMSTIS